MRGIRILFFALLALPLAACTSSSGSGKNSGTKTPTEGGDDAAGDDDADDDDEAAVEGTAPVVKSLTFSPKPDRDHPNKDEAITATVETSDADEDGVIVEWTWFHNGEEIIGAASDTLVPEGRFKKGDKIEAQALPRDTRGAKGKALKKGLVIGNLPPTITSVPTGNLDGYQVGATDPDEDKLTYEIDPATPGITISPEGVLKATPEGWKAAAGKKLAIVVKDPTGAFSRQEFDVPPAP